MYSCNYACPDCGFSFPELTPRMFSFNNPFGACPTCTGIGYLMKMDEDLIVPDKNKTLYDGIKAFGSSTMKKGDTMAKMYFESIGKHYGVDIKNKKIKDLPRWFMEKILYGTGDEEIDFEYSSYAGTRKFTAPFEGVLPTLDRRHHETKSQGMRDFYEMYMTNSHCPDCHGARLKPEILSIKVGGKNINELTEMSIRNIKEYLNKLELNKTETMISELILKEIDQRLQFLIDVGLEYLTLSRSAGTLSGGEAQRIRLATQIGSGLTGVLYILDEPSIGLHQRDNDKLLATLKKLRDLGNTLIVVEHDEDTMYAADQIIDIGPGAGSHGGNVMAQGTAEEVKQVENSITGQYLSGRKKIAVPKTRRKAVKSKVIEVQNATENNLKNVSVKFPLGLFNCVTGVSGSGKSTLIKLILKEEEPTSGNIIINGKDTTFLKPSRVPYLRRSMGVVFQDFRLLPDKTVYDNVAYAMYIVRATPRHIRRQVPMVLSLVGLSNKAKVYPNELSGGEQQRVALARALVNNPSMLIADEPTGNLDPDTAWDIMTLLNDINMRGTTVVVATHAKDIVDKMKKRVIQIEDGHIIRDDKKGGYNSEV